MNSKTHSIGIVPGSFDPITNGHVDIARRASELCDRVYLAVMINDKKRYMFSMAERKKIAEAALIELENVEVICSDGMLWQLAKELGAEVIIKGVRNEADREYELEMAKYNTEHAPNTATLLLDCREELSSLSSTLVRDLLENGKSIDEFLPEEACLEVKRILSERK